MTTTTMTRTAVIGAAIETTIRLVQFRGSVHE